MLFDRTIPAFAVTFLLLAVSPSHAQDPQQEAASKPHDSSSKPASPPDDMKPKSTAKQKKDTATKNAADQPARDPLRAEKGREVGQDDMKKGDLDESVHRLDDA